MSLTASDKGSGVSQAKVSRVTQQSIEMLRNVKKFFNVEFNITECDDDVYSESSDEEEKEESKQSEN